MRTRGNLWLISLTILLIILVIIPAAGVKAQEQTEKRTVRVGWFEANGLQTGTDMESIGGYNYEYLVKIAQYEGWNYEFVFGNWAELEQQLIDGKIDILGDVAVTEERVKQYNFCNYPNGYSRMYMACRIDDIRFNYNDYISFDGITVATIPSTFRRQLLDREAKTHGFEVSYQEQDTQAEMFEALSIGEADVAIFSDVTEYKDVKIISEWEPNPYYFIVNKDQKIMLYELNDAMMHIQSADIFMQERLYEKYFETNGTNSILALTKEEAAYVQSAKPLRVLLCTDRHPISYVQDGEVKGLIPDYCNQLSKNSGLQFEYVLCDSYKEMIEKFYAGEGEICAQLHDDLAVDASQDFYSLKSYYTLTYGLSYYLSKEENIHTVGVEDGDYYLAQILVDAGYQPVYFKNVSTSMKALKAETVDAVLVSSLTYQSLSRHPSYEKLHFTLLPAVKEGLYIGTSQYESSALFTTLSKSTGSISDQQIAEMLLEASTGKIDYTPMDRLIQNMKLIYMSIILVIISLVFMIWMHHQQKNNAILYKAKEDLEKANDRSNEFFSNLSHDIRTPLTGVIGYTDLALEEHPPEHERFYFEKIRISSHLLLNLINDTLTVSKIRAGKWKVEPEAMQVGVLVESVLIAIASTAKLKNITIHKEYMIPQAEYILADALKLQDVLMNLLSNAVKYTLAGGNVYLSVSRIIRDGKSESYCYEIRDDGIGMSGEFLERIYDPFIQEHAPKSDQATGTGLGMTIVQQIIKMMNGSITIESKQDVGTTCTVVLPVIPLDDNLEEYGTNLIDDLKQPDDWSSLSGLHVLLCEDNRINTEIVTKILNRQDVRLSYATDGREGVRCFQESELDYYQVILMDLRMPIMDGFTATRTIRELEREDAKRVPIIAISADAYREDVDKAMESGMTAHLSKPIIPNELYRALVKYGTKK